MNAITSTLAQAPAIHPESPPGYSKIETLINWTAKLSITACVVGVLVCAATIAIQHRRQTLTPETGGQLATVLVACVLIGVAAQVVNSLV